MASPTPEPSFEDFISGSAIPILMLSIETDNFMEPRYVLEPAPLLAPPNSALKHKAPRLQVEEKHFMGKIYIDLTEVENSPEPSPGTSKYLTPAEVPHERDVENGRVFEDNLDAAAEISEELNTPPLFVSPTPLTPLTPLTPERCGENERGSENNIDSAVQNPEVFITPPLFVSPTPPHTPDYHTPFRPQPNPEPPTPSLNQLSCQERKRLVISTRPAKLIQDLKAWLASTTQLLDPFLEDAECWLHPSPPPPRLTKNGLLISRRSISKRFTFTSPSPHAPVQLQTHSLTIPYGIAHHLVYHTLTLQRQDGWINQTWQNSHLCGNWTCLNPKHLTVESAGVNGSRNNCFSHRRGCFHQPVCLKDYKVPLGSDGLLVEIEEGGVYLGGGGEGDGWAGLQFGEDDGVVKDEEDGDVGMDYGDYGGLEPGGEFE